MNPCDLGWKQTYITSLYEYPSSLWSYSTLDGRVYYDGVCICVLHTLKELKALMKGVKLI